MTLSTNLFLKVMLDGYDIAKAPSVVSTISLTEGNGTFFPACLLTLNDLGGTLTKDLNIVDGSSLVITAGVLGSDVGVVTRQYRVFGHNAPASSGGSTFKVAGMYDAPDYTTANVRESYKGPSSKVIKEIASKCKLEYDGPSGDTKDEQVWLNICKTRCSFVGEVTRRGYIDDNSAMSSTLTSLGVLKYKNLMEIIDTTPKYTLSHNVIPAGIKGTGYLVRQAKNSSSAGMTNTWQNYGSTKVTHSLSGVLNIERKLEINTDKEYLPINAQVSKTVGMSRVDYGPLDCSNVHEKYERALYQNLRLLGLFSQKTSVLLYETTDIQLYDCVLYKQADSDFSTVSVNSDNYIVTGKTVFIKHGRTYAERLELLKMSVTNPGQSKLMTQDPSSSRVSSTPDVFSSPILDYSAKALSVVSLINTVYQAVSSPTSLAMGALGRLSTSLVAVNPALSPLASVVTQRAVGRSVPMVTNSLRSLAIPTSTLLSSLDSLVTVYSGHKGVVNSLAVCANTAIGYSRPKYPQYNTLTYEQQGLMQRQFSTLNNNALLSRGGAVDGISIALPALTCVSRTCRVYNTLNKELAPHENKYDPNDIAILKANIEELNSKYMELTYAIKQHWNNCMSAAQGLRPTHEGQSEFLNSSVDHSSILVELADKSISTPNYSGNNSLPIRETTSSIGRIMAVKDLNGYIHYVALDTPEGLPNYLYEVSPVNFSSLDQELSSLYKDTEKLNNIAQNN